MNTLSESVVSKVVVVSVVTVLCVELDHSVEVEISIKSQLKSSHGHPFWQYSRHGQNLRFSAYSRLHSGKQLNKVLIENKYDKRI